MEPANCAKTFLFKPLQPMFKGFSNPSNDKYAWIGAKEAEIIFLMISGGQVKWLPRGVFFFFFLLEEQTVHLSSQKDNHGSDITISSDVPSFAAGKSEILFRGRVNSGDFMEHNMTAAWWVLFAFFHQISVEKQKEIHPCHKCLLQNGTSVVLV